MNIDRRTLVTLTSALCCFTCSCAHAAEKAHLKPHFKNDEKVRWCHEAVTENWAGPEVSRNISGTVAGRTFECDKVQWNSYSLTFKQDHKRYCKIVINMMKTQKPLCRLSFTSDSNRRPEIYVYTRDNNAAKIVEKHYTAGDGYGLRLELRDLVADDAVPGRLVLRLPDGSFISGQFLAEKAPRVIWDDEQIK